MEAPNARVAYVAQHAFHHIEQHLDKTPNEYIRWRFQHGDDKEALVKDTMVLTEEEKAKCKEPCVFELKDDKGNVSKVKWRIEKLTGGRKQIKKEYEYEVQFVGMDYNSNRYVSATKLAKWGFEKHMKVVDEKVAQRAGAFSTPLTNVNVEKHLEDVGLDKEFGTHTRMAALSGGQKVKVVIAAAMWNQPHIVILDEPTNYLDRDSLGALAGAIEVFEGGVVMITHNNEFCSALCPETWLMQKADDGIALQLQGRRRVDGEAVQAGGDGRRQDGRDDGCARQRRRGQGGEEEQGQDVPRREEEGGEDQEGRARARRDRHRLRG